MARISKTLLQVFFSLAMVVSLSTPENAGSYHSGKNMNCSDCHVTHASATHDTSGNAVSQPMAATPNLLKGASINQMCLQCHDSQPGIPDVMGTDINNPTESYDGTERAGGNFFDGNTANWKGHSLTGQGNRGTVDCIMCHDPHGNSNYRNLKALDGTTNGPVAFVNPLANGLDKYQRSNIGYVKYIGEKLCVRCHDYGAQGSVAASGSGGYHRHPSSEESMVITIGSSRERVDSAHWVSGNGSGFSVDGIPVPRVPFAMRSATNFQAASTVSRDNEVFCLSCHKAHGSVHAFGLIWPYGSGTGLQSSAGCNQCHNVSGD